MQKIKIKKLHPEAKIPARQSSGAAGYDIYALEETTINPGEVVFVRTGISLELPKGVVAFIYPRASFCMKKDLDMPHSVGVGDEDFRGEYLVPYRNLGKMPQTIEKFERCAQFVFMNYLAADLVEVDQLTDTERGEGGFGSTGKK